MSRAILDARARFASADQAMAYGRERMIDAFAAHDEICRIRSIHDGTHQDGSSHYMDRAEDYSVDGITEEKRLAILRDGREAMNAGALVYGNFEGTPDADYLLIYGEENHKQHFHLQWKSWRAMNR